MAEHVGEGGQVVGEVGAVGRLNRNTLTDDWFRHWELSALIQIVTVSLSSPFPIIISILSLKLTLLKIARPPDTSCRIGDVKCLSKIKLVREDKNDDIKDIANGENIEDDDIEDL